MVGLLRVKIMAKGKQRSRAQIRESGLGDSMVVCCRVRPPLLISDLTDLIYGPPNGGQRQSE